MRRLFLIISIVFAFTLVAAACGSDDDSTEVGTDTSGDGGDAAADEPDTSDADDADTGDDGVPLGAGPYPIADVMFTVDLGNDTMIDYRLACLGDTATFTGDSGTLDASAACIALTEDEVRARLLGDDHNERICTEIYGGPEVAEITGTLDDQSINTTVNRSNGCGIDDWQRVLGALLPNPLG